MDFNYLAQQFFGDTFQYGTSLIRGEAERLEVKAVRKGYKLQLLKMKTEIENSKKLFWNNIKTIENSYSEEITQKGAFYKKINDDCQAHLEYIDDMPKIIKLCTTTALAEKEWNEFQAKHQEFKNNFNKNVENFETEYNTEIARLQDINDSKDFNNQNQSLENTSQKNQELEQLKQYNKQLMQKNEQLTQDNEQLTQDNEQLKNECAHQSNFIIGLQGKLLDLQDKLLDKTEGGGSADYNKDAEEELDEFLNAHQDTEHEDKLVGILGDLSDSE